MPSSSDKRERLVNAARILLHRQGFSNTTLAQIAKASGVPLGNVYYYFKTKEEIAAAAIRQRRDKLRSMAEKWEANPDPKQRLSAFLDMIEDMRLTIAKYGCPVGSLCQELDKSRSGLAENANETLRWMIDWTSEQFRLLGKTNAEELGLQFITILQGISLVAQVLNNPNLISQQVRQTRTWLQTL
jgi:AcrR family transcriptional regulator